MTEAAMHRPGLWTPRQGGIRIPEEYHLTVPLKPGWENHKFHTKIYQNSPQDKAEIDKVFDALRTEGKMTDTVGHTHFGAPVFVKWRTTIDEKGAVKRKGRPVLDMREINDWVEKDSFPLTLQYDIISLCRNCEFLSVIDGLSYFYQWWIKASDRYKLAINSHRGQKSLNVAFMGFKNSVQYCQRMGNLILKDMPWAKAYIDDFVIFSKNLKEHERHLKLFFERLDELNFCLAPAKAFIGFPSIKLLGQKVDAYGFSTPEEKLKALRDLEYPENASELERYLGFAGTMRDNVPYYAHLTEPLHDLKALALRNAPKKGRARAGYATNQPVPKSGELLDAFNNVQRQWDDPKNLAHVVPKRTLYIDCDTSRGAIGCMAYYVTGDPDPTFEASDPPPGYRHDASSPTFWLKRVKDFAKGRIEPVLFASKTLSPAERNYSPTELEMCGAVWIVKKLRHLVEGANKCYLLLDHAALVALAKQKTLAFTSLDRCNLKLATASMYLQGFENLIIEYRPGPNHIAPDCISRMKRKHIPPTDLRTDILRDLAPVFHTLFVEMEPDFRKKLHGAYEADPHWNRILAVTEGRTEDSDNEQPHASRPLQGLRFFERKGLLYHWDRVDGTECLCIPDSMAREIFEQAHDENFHPEFERTRSRIRTTFYIRKLSEQLRKYIEHCPPCIQNQTKRHKKYGDMEPIESPGTPYLYITIDLITNMPATTAEGFEMLMKITCKASKKVLLVPGHATWSSAQWAVALNKNLYDKDWGISLVIISDRDPRFIKGLFHKLFTMIKSKFNATAAWHPQTDGQSERTDRTVEIALRYFLTRHPDMEWIDALPFIQFFLNNSINATTGISPNEFVTGMRPRDSLDLVADVRKKDFEELRLQYRDCAAESLAFANAKMKYQYDRKHKPLNLKVGDWVELNLHGGYKTAGHLNRKFDLQRDGPFQVLEKVSKNAYKLDLPGTMKIHPVINVTQLEPAPKGKDPFGRRILPEAGELIEDNDEKLFYEISKLLNRRVHPKTGELQYHVRWNHWGPSHQKWLPISALDNAAELRAEYDELHPPTTEEKRKIQRAANQISRKSRRTQSKPAKDKRRTYNELEAGTPAHGEPHVPGQPAPRLRERSNHRGFGTPHDAPDTTQDTQQTDNG